jgi:hypothetical protein
LTGERQEVREAIAAYFGGLLVTTDAGNCYQRGPLMTSGLGTAYPYAPKGVPDGYYTAGMPAGHGWGAIMGVAVFQRQRQRQSLGGWFSHFYNVQCRLVVISEEPHVETAEAGLDDLLDAMLALLYADPTLGTTTPDGRLITEAGENFFGNVTEGMAGTDASMPFQPVLNGDGTPDKRGRWAGDATFGFWAYLAALVPTNDTPP